LRAGDGFFLQKKVSFEQLFIHIKNPYSLQNTLFFVCDALRRSFALQIARLIPWLSM
jgi:hypothetical protein